MVERGGGLARRRVFGPELACNKILTKLAPTLSPHYSPKPNGDSVGASFS
jgi:hypothetical protein